MDLKVFLSFYNQIVEEVEDDICDATKEIKDCKKILVVKSARNSSFEAALEKIRILNPNIEMFVLGDTGCDYLRSQGIDSNHFWYHKGRFEDFEDVSLYRHILEIEEIKHVLYINYATFRSSYVNVMDYVGRVADNIATVMAYNVNDERVIMHKDVRGFSNNLKIIAPIVRYGEGLSDVIKL